MEGRRDQGSPLATTFIVSFEYLKTEYPDAADLLSIMSFFDRQQIFGLSLPGNDTDILDFEDSIGLLVAFSFVTEDSPEDEKYDSRSLGSLCSSYSMHRLVHLATRAWLRETESKGGDGFALQAMQLISQKPPSRLPRMPSTFLTKDENLLSALLDLNELH